MTSNNYHSLTAPCLMVFLVCCFPKHVPAPKEGGFMIDVFVQRLADLVSRWRHRLEGRVDVLTADRGRWRVFWPMHREAEIVIQREVPNARRKRGGYAVPRAQGSAAYDAIHHNGCPLIATECAFATIIDTP